MTAAPKGLALVSSIINLAHSLQLKVVAEGVETEEQSRLLRVLGCDEMQGYLFSKPVPCEIFEARQGIGHRTLQLNADVSQFMPVNTATATSIMANAASLGMGAGHSIASSVPWSRAVMSATKLTAPTIWL
jgi:c-di-GMP-related signal transduction protein